MDKFLYLDKWIIQKINGSGPVLSREELEAYQYGKLIETITHMKISSSFYQNKLSSFSCSDIRGLEDLRRLPFTTADDLRREPMSMVCVPAGEISRIVTLETSGSTGAGKRIFFSSDDQELTIDYFHNGMQNLVNASDTVLILLPYKTPGSVGDLLRQGLERIGCVAVGYGLVDNPEKMLHIIKEKGITSMVGNPRQVLSVAEADRESASRKNNICLQSIRSVLLSTEYIPDEACEKISSIWNCRVFEHYGMTEMGLGCAVSCFALSGYHPREADLLIEVIDPKSGEVLPDGEYGEIVFTTLTRKAMPLLRYRTGDISRFLVDTCPCGSKLKRLEKVGRRSFEKMLK